MPMGVSPRADLIGRGHDGLGEHRFGRGEVADKFFRSLLGHDFVQTREPLGGQSVVDGMGHDQFAAVLRFDDLFESLGILAGLDVGFYCK